MTRIITDAEFIQAFDEAVAERGRDFVYTDDMKVPDESGVPACVYNLPDGAPSCVWGLALHKLGLPPIPTDLVTDIMEIASESSPEDAHDPHAELAAAEIWRLESNVSFRLTQQTRRAALSAQTAQDTGNPWGYASDIFHSTLDGEEPGAD